MRFLVDMGVSPRVAQRLRGEGHDVVHLRDEGLQSLSDFAVFKKAFNEQRVLLTFDLDFGEIVALSGSQSVSVVLFRLRDARTDRVLDRLLEVLRRTSAALASGAIVVVEETRLRVRRLPLIE